VKDGRIGLVNCCHLVAGTVDGHHYVYQPAIPSDYISQSLEVIIG
jgi:hypothetical protein